ncbi:MAG TPA: esterase-like activity of phytase family protein [Allosphingosinicella sp.]|nr:esterase-like activity of phytase family protein [Allosphingosinicella sp.]
MAKRGPMRVLAAFLILLLLGTFAPPARYRPKSPPRHVITIFERVPLDWRRPKRATVGALTWLGGWAIQSNDPRFGGISALHVDGDQVTALSDTGMVIRFGFSSAIPDMDIRPLSAGPGSADIKGDRDAESMAVQGGRLWVGFERSNAIWRYDLKDWRPQGSARPQAMRRWRSNRGAEAMVRLPGGRFLVFSEGGGGESPVILFHGDPARPGTRAETMRYLPPLGYRITDAALLPDGRLLLLHRRVRMTEGVSAKLTIARLPSLAAGALISGREIAVLRTPVAVDNMEGLSVTSEHGRTIVWIASDDNFNPLQRTLLLKFAL